MRRLKRQQAVNERAFASHGSRPFRTTHCFHTLAHAAQAEPFFSSRSLAIVGDMQFDGPLVVCKPDAARMRRRVAHDVGDRLAQGKGQNVFLRYRNSQRFRIAIERNSRGLKGISRVFEFRIEPSGAIATDGRTDLCQSIARDALDITNFRSGANGIAVGKS
jgi:hypothetical protein